MTLSQLAHREAAAIHRQAVRDALAFMAEVEHARPPEAVIEINRLWKPTEQLEAA